MAPPAEAPTVPSTLLNTISSHVAPINSLAFSSLGGTYILSGSSDRQIHLSRTEPLSGPSAPSTSTTPVTTPTSSVRNGRGHSRNPGTDGASGTQPIQKYAAHGYAVLGLSCARDNQSFASCGGDRVVFLWDVQSATTLRRLGGSNSNEGHTGKVNAISFAGEGDSVLVSGSDDRTVRLWDVRSRSASPIMVLDDARDGVSCLHVDLGGEVIISGSIDGQVRSYDVRMGMVKTDVLPGSVVSLDATKTTAGAAEDGALLVGCSQPPDDEAGDGWLGLLDRRDGKLLRELKDGYTNTGLRLSSCLAANDSLVLSGAEADGKVRGWDVVTGEIVAEVEASEKRKVISVVVWREGNKTAGRRGVWAAGGVDGVVRIYG